MTSLPDSDERQALLRKLSSSRGKLFLLITKRIQETDLASYQDQSEKMFLLMEPLLDKYGKQELYVWLCQGLNRNSDLNDLGDSKAISRLA